MHFLVSTLVAVAIATAVTVHPERVRVAPAAARAATTFTVSFRAPNRTGVIGSLRRTVVVSGQAAASGSGCLAAFAVQAPATSAGRLVRVSLAPARLHGHLCVGTFGGRVVEEQAPVCKPGQACPQFVVLLGVIGRFSFVVRP